MQGVGVHSGADASLVVSPAADGIRFHQSPGSRGIAASWRHVTATKLATVLSNGTEEVRTVEHLMAALAALGITGARIEIDGPEVPIMDGSAAPFVDRLAAQTVLAGPREAIRVRRPIIVSVQSSFAALLPYDGRRFDVEIDFPDAIIGRQRVLFDLDADDFARDIAPARTFGRLRDVRRLRRRGYGKGASLQNAIAVDGERVANPEGLRFPDEFARHKLLDAIGDLALAERPILATYRGYKAGHRLNFELLKRLFSDRDNYVLVS